MEEIRIICSIPEGEGDSSLAKEVAVQLGRADMSAELLCCRSKQEVEYAVYREKGGGYVLLEEDSFAREPYQAWEVAALRDICRIPVAFVLSRRHYATAYMDILYAAGILNAVYEDEKDPSLIAALLRKERRRRECREYYGIRSLHDTASVLQVMEQERIERYIRYIGSGLDGGDIRKRYGEVERQLTFVENCCLVGNLPESVMEELEESEEMERYRMFQGTLSGNK